MSDDKNRFKRKAAAGELALIAGNLEQPDLVDLLGSTGAVDAVWLDMEHGTVSWNDLANLTRAADLWGMSSIVRVRDNDPALISLTLGEGADGVVVPHVGSRSDAERAVSAAKFEPTGTRSAGGGRKSYGRDDYFVTANDDTIVSVMIEDVAALDQLADILRVPHVDMYFVARYDLAASMGLLHDPLNQRVIDLYDDAIRVILAAGGTVGAVVAERDLAKYLAMGVRCIKTPQLTSWITAGAQRFAATAQSVGQEQT